MRGKHALIQDRRDFLEQALDHSADKHDKDWRSTKAREASKPPMGERISFTGKLLGEHAERHNKYAKDFEALRNSHGSRHAGVQRRLDFIEKTLGDSADKYNKHASEIEARRDSHYGHELSHASWRIAWPT